MYPDNPGWLAKFGSYTARFYEHVKPNGGGEIEVHLGQRVKDAPTQSLKCDLATLKEAVKRGHEHQDGFHFKPGFDAKHPDRVEEVGEYKVSYFAREKPDGERQVALYIERKKTDGEAPEQGRRMLCDLGRLQKIVEEGTEFERALGDEKRYLPVVKIEEPSERPGRALARIEKLFKVGEGKEGREHAEKAGREYAFKNKDSGFHFYPEPIIYRREKESFIEILKGVKGAEKQLNDAIDLVHFNRERLGTNYVVAQWAEKTHDGKTNILAAKPKAEVAWDGRQTTYDGEPRDFLADFSGRTDGRDIPANAPWILIRKDEQKPFRGTIVEVFKTREEAVSRLQRLEERDRMLGPDWHKQQLGMRQSM